MLRRIIDSPWLYFAGAALLVSIAVWTQVEFKLPTRPAGTAADIASLRDRDDLNLVFILVDTLRADRLSINGYERETTPTLDSLAKSGIRFSSVQSQSSWTKASMASMWTSTYPQRNGITRFSHAVPEDALMPAEIMRDAGMTTAGIWRNGWVAPNFGFSQGFDLYVRPNPLPSQQAIRNNPSQHPLQGTDYDATQSVLEFLAANKKERFFLYVHYMDLHQYTYDQASTLFGSTYSDFYDNALHWTDRNIAHLYEAMEEAGILDRTVIVIAADHGEAFFEHGDEGHGKTLYAEVQNVPWLIFLPFRLDEEIAIDTPVANVDIFPTLLDLMGLPPLPAAQGRSLIPLIMAEAAGQADPEFEERSVYSQIDRNWGHADQDPQPMFSVVKKPYKLIHGTAARERPLLYNRDTDPTEQQNLAATEPEKVEELEALIEAYEQDNQPPWGATPEIQLDEMRLNQLRALGYALPKK